MNTLSNYFSMVVIFLYPHIEKEEETEWCHTIHTKWTLHYYEKNATKGYMPGRVNSTRDNLYTSLWETDHGYHWTECVQKGVLVRIYMTERQKKLIIK